jgi:hypothetical protein
MRSRAFSNVSSRSLIGGFQFDARFDPVPDRLGMTWRIGSFGGLHVKRLHWRAAGKRIAATGPRPSPATSIT